MNILHVTDFHFNKSWFHWLHHGAPAHDLLVVSGDLLNLTDATPRRKQVAWVSDWISEYPRPMSIASGEHDREWNEQLERWTPAYWLRDLSNPWVWTDGQRVELDGLSILNIGCTTQPKGGAADVWVVHAPPTQTLVAARTQGGDGGDPDLATQVPRYAPRLVLSGHVHDPVHWRAHDGQTLFLNPGRNPDGDFPNHILVNTGRMTARFVGTTGESCDTFTTAPACAAGVEAAAATF